MMGEIFVWGLLHKDGKRKPNIISRNAKDFKIHQGWKKTCIKAKFSKQKRKTWDPVRYPVKIFMSFV